MSSLKTESPNENKPDPLKTTIILIRFYEVMCSLKETTKSYIKFAQENLADYLNQHWDEPYLMDMINDLRMQSYRDRKHISP